MFKKIGLILLVSNLAKPILASEEPPLRSKCIVEQIDENRLRATLTLNKGCKNFLAIVIRDLATRKDTVETKSITHDGFGWTMMTGGAAKPETIADLKSRLDRYMFAPHMLGDLKTSTTNNWPYGPDRKPEPEFVCHGCDHEPEDERG
jgi:hypothetical protein